MVMINKLYLVSSQKPLFAAVFTASSRFYSQDIRTLNPELAFLKRGTGGRSSFNGNVVTVFGATGLLGRYLCNELGKIGCQLIIPYRCDFDDPYLKRLKLCGDLGQVLYQPFDLRDQLSIRKAIKFSNIVVNLIGKGFETKNFDFYSVHVKGAAEIAKACREFNVERLIHFSSLNLTDNPKRYYLKKSNFLPTKLLGEKAVLEEFPDATVFRPSCIYGYFDRFLWPMCHPKRSLFLSIPLYKNGKETIKQPVYVNDVAVAVANAINDYGTRGTIFQAVGPHRLYLHDIAIFLFQIMQRQMKNLWTCTHDIKYDPFFFAKILISTYLLRGHFFAPYNNLCFPYIELESVTDVVDKNLPTLEDLGVELTSFEEAAPPIVLRNFLFSKDYWRSLNDYIHADSLTKKALNDYDI